MSQGEVVTIEVGSTRYAFSPRTGQLISMDVAGQSLVTDLSPTLWRKLDDNEALIMGQDPFPDLDRHTPTVRSWRVSEGDTVTIEAVVDYVVDSENRFTASYEYRVGGDGRLQVRYAFTTKVKAPWVPVVGMKAQTAPRLTQLRWLGLGPHDAYPNRRMAAILGVWGGDKGSADTVGVKSTRWIDLAAPGAARLRVFNEGYLDQRAHEPNTVRILSDVVGRPEKGRKADEAAPQLTTNGDPFVGSFTLAALAD